ncbi:MAG: glycosyltransferase [Rhodospirillaceae bacterium]|nr:glycosyltransferase [Rhodospirillales bacterium]
MTGLRIALLLHSPSGGGAQRRTLDLAGALAAQGARVRLVMASAEGPLADRLPANVEIVVLKGAWARAHRMVQCAAIIPALTCWLRRERPHILMAAANHVHLTALAAHALAGGRTRLVLRASNHLEGGSRGQPLMDWLKRLSVRLYARADAVVAVSEDLAGQLRRLCPAAKISVLPNPVVDASFPARMNAAAPHPWLGEPVLLGCGRLEKQKGFPTLVRAAARLGMRLIILGEGRERPHLEALACELGVPLALPGFVPDPLPWMAHATAFALSSAWEGMPGALIEAMACGCPCVATNAPGGGVEVLAGLGPLVAIGDDRALAQALSDIMAAPPPPEALKLRAAQYSVEAGARAYGSLFTALTAASP